VDHAVVVDGKVAASAPAGPPASAATPTPTIGATMRADKFKRARGPRRSLFIGSFLGVDAERAAAPCGDARVNIPNTNCAPS